MPDPTHRAAHKATTEELPRAPHPYIKWLRGLAIVALLCFAATLAAQHQADLGDPCKGLLLNAECILYNVKSTELELNHGHLQLKNLSARPILDAARQTARQQDILPWTWSAGFLYIDTVFVLAYTAFFGVGILWCKEQIQSRQLKSKPIFVGLAMASILLGGLADIGENFQLLDGMSQPLNEIIPLAETIQHWSAAKFALFFTNLGMVLLGLFFLRDKNQPKNPQD